MKRRRLLPWWLTALLAAAAVALVAIGTASLLRPHWVFGSEGYRTVARLPIGLFGAAAVALGGGLALNLFRGQADLLRASLASHLAAAALFAPVITFNVGAVDGLKKATGITGMMLAFAVVGLVSVPAVIAMRYLRQDEGQPTRFRRRL